MAKQYNPWTGFLEDTATKASVKDAAPIVGKKYTIRGKEFKVLEVKGDNVKVLGSDGIVSHLNIRMFDEKPTIDNAIRSMDSAKSDAREVYNILAQALQNSTNPNKVSELISKAQGKLLEMAARAKDSKCKTAIDKSIRNCDSEKIILPEISDTWRLIDKYNIKYTKNAGGIQIDVDEAVSKGVNKEYIKKLSNMSKLYGRGDF